MGAVREATGRRLALRTLLIAVGSIGLIITGLLGMHVFSADAPGHGSLSSHVIAQTIQGSPQASASVLDESAAGEASTPRYEVTSASGSPEAPGHIDMVTACVLALLLSLALLLPPTCKFSLDFRARFWGGTVRRARTKVPTQAPLLLLYSISRT